jgi:hypothetical protein
VVEIAINKLLTAGLTGRRPSLALPCRTAACGHQNNGHLCKWPFRRPISYCNLWHAFETLRPRWPMRLRVARLSAFNPWEISQTMLANDVPT